MTTHYNLQHSQVSTDACELVGTLWHLGKPLARKYRCELWPRFCLVHSVVLVASKDLSKAGAHAPQFLLEISILLISDIAVIRMLSLKSWLVILTASLSLLELKILCLAH